MVVLLIWYKANSIKLFLFCLLEKIRNLKISKDGFELQMRNESEILKKENLSTLNYILKSKDKK
jgi:hypothetical protein